MTTQRRRELEPETMNYQELAAAFGELSARVADVDTLKIALKTRREEVLSLKLVVMEHDSQILVVTTRVDEMKEVCDIAVGSVASDWKEIKSVYETV